MTELAGRTIPARTSDPGTSHDATAAVSVRAGSQRALLLKAWDRGEATDEEAMRRASGVSPTSEYAKRASELRDAGLIEPTGWARPGSAGVMRMISRLTPQGREVLATLAAQRILSDLGEPTRTTDAREALVSAGEDRAWRLEEEADLRGQAEADGAAADEVWRT